MNGSDRAAEPDWLLVRWRDGNRDRFVVSSTEVVSPVADNYMPNQTVTLYYGNRLRTATIIAIASDRILLDPVPDRFEPVPDSNMGRRSPSSSPDMPSDGAESPEPIELQNGSRRPWLERFHRQHVNVRMSALSRRPSEIHRPIPILPEPAPQSNDSSDLTIRPPQRRFTNEELRRNFNTLVSMIISEAEFKSTLSFMASGSVDPPPQLSRLLDPSSRSSRSSHSPSRPSRALEPPPSQPLRSIEPPPSRPLRSLDPPPSRPLWSLDPPPSRPLQSLDPPSRPSVSSDQPSRSSVSSNLSSRPSVSLDLPPRPSGSLDPTSRPSESFNLQLRLLRPSNVPSQPSRSSDLQIARTSHHGNRPSGYINETVRRFLDLTDSSCPRESRDDNIRENVSNRDELSDDDDDLKNFNGTPAKVKKQTRTESSNTAISNTGRQRSTSNSPQPSGSLDPPSQPSGSSDQHVAQASNDTSSISSNDTSSISSDDITNTCIELINLYQPGTSRPRKPRVDDIRDNSKPAKVTKKTRTENLYTKTSNARKVRKINSKKTQHTSSSRRRHNRLSLNASDNRTQLILPTPPARINEKTSKVIKIICQSFMEVFTYMKNKAERGILPDFSDAPNVPYMREILSALRRSGQFMVIFPSPRPSRPLGSSHRDPNLPGPSHFMLPMREEQNSDDDMEVSSLSSLSSASPSPPKEPSQKK
ncbi:hypothetical protein HW555_004396 [Spodoptera exigua]|uniref:Uncharacterized protein n=1 Tax=Spodoptera exigua TaxID=7107 RepID=A0A835GLS6_SPOEX|nr:hypothetical protein HW555_004396 [Spodoptera exigua]